MDNGQDDMAEVIAETDRFVVWRTDEEGELTYHIELGPLTLHLDEGEWRELISLINSA